MNWQFLLMSLFGFSIFFVVVVTFLFYLQHRLVRTYKRKAPTDLHHPVDGRYFKRFLPLELKSVYEEKVTEYEAKKNPALQWSDYRWHAVVCGLALVVTFGYLRDHWHEFIKPIDVTESEMQKISQERHRLTLAFTENLPTMSELQSQMKKSGLVILKTPTEDVPEAPRSAVARVATEHWKKWAAKNKLRETECDIQKWKSCSQKFGQPVYVVLPGEWKKEILDELATSGASIILYGPPGQAMAAGGSWNWRGLQFDFASTNIYPHLILKGDTALTLGFDAGLKLAVTPFYNRYHASADAADGYAISPDHTIGGALGARLKSFRAESGRVVWMDFSPNASDQPTDVNTAYFDALVASTFRYLLHAPAKALATWPEGKPFAAFVAFDLDENDDRASDIKNFAMASAVPMTWFLLSDFIQRDRKLSRDLASAGEMACAGDSRLPFVTDTLNAQIRRLARCRKIVRELTGEAPRGLHPPEEQLNDETFSSLLDNEMTYVFSRNVWGRSVPIVHRGSNDSHRLIEIGRNSSDDFHLMHVLGLDPIEARARVTDEIAWTKSVGGLYTYNFASRSLANEGQVQIVESAVTALRSGGAYFETAHKIATWWSIRHDLMIGRTVSSDLLAKFKPVWIEIDENGELKRTPL